MNDYGRDLIVLFLLLSKAITSGEGMLMTVFSKILGSNLKDSERQPCAKCGRG